jgi:putative transposase
MPRTARVAPGGLVYHVLNRSVARIKLFRKPADFEAFEHILLEAHRRVPIPLLGWCIMSNHWHVVPSPGEDGELTEFFRWLTLTHAMRWRVSHHTVGYGPLYQGRFKSFPIEDECVPTVCRYVERNPLTAGLVQRAQDWRWSSLWAREHGSAELQALLAPWPVKRPANWLELVNRPMRPKEVERLKVSMTRGRPFGSELWTQRTVRGLGLERTLRPRGRPRNGAPQ